jgi:hypothetical protein
MAIRHVPVARHGDHRHARCINGFNLADVMDAHRHPPSLKAIGETLMAKATQDPKTAPHQTQTPRRIRRPTTAAVIHDLAQAMTEFSVAHSSRADRHGAPGFGASSMLPLGKVTRC